MAEGTLAGHVKKVRVEAFKCHDHFEVELGCVNILPLQTIEHTEGHKASQGSKGPQAGLLSLR